VLLMTALRCWWGSATKTLAGSQRVLRGVMSSTDNSSYHGWHGCSSAHNDSWSSHLYHLVSCLRLTLIRAQGPLMLNNCSVQVTSVRRRNLVTKRTSNSERRTHLSDFDRISYYVYTTDGAN